VITEPYIIKADGVVEAWKSAARLLVEQGDRFNLNVHIASPASLNEAEVAAFCHRRVAPEISKSVYDVANTIFPAASAYHGGDLKEFFAHYQKVYERGQRRYRNSWGTYFLRLVAFGEDKENQLGKVMHGLSNWKSKPHAAFVLHLSSADLDNPRPLGAPCWQYAQFIRSGDDVLSLSAVYRSHDYFQKALGNFVGLTRLLRFVCERSNMMPGTLTCLSTFASLQNEKVKSRQLLGIQ
jgi:thymidylate synthase